MFAATALRTHTPQQHPDGPQQLPPTHILCATHVWCNYTKKHTPLENTPHDSIGICCCCCCQQGACCCCCCCGWQPCWLLGCLEGQAGTARHCCSAAGTKTPQGTQCPSTHGHHKEHRWLSGCTARLRPRTARTAVACCPLACRAAALLLLMLLLLHFQEVPGCWWGLWRLAAAGCSSKMHQAVEAGGRCSADVSSTLLQEHTPAAEIHSCGEKASSSSCLFHGQGFMRVQAQRVCRPLAHQQEQQHQCAALASALLLEKHCCGPMCSRRTTAPDLGVQTHEQGSCNRAQQVTAGRCSCRLLLRAMMQTLRKWPDKLARLAENKQPFRLRLHVHQ